VEIPTAVTDLGAFAYDQCTSLAVIHGGASLTSMGEGAFRGCLQLQNPIFPEYVTELSDSVYFGCRAFRSIQIPAWVTSIGQEGFYGCSRVIVLEVPVSVTAIGENAFGKCRKVALYDIPDAFNTYDELTRIGLAHLAHLAPMADPLEVSLMGALNHPHDLSAADESEGEEAAFLPRHAISNIESVPVIGMRLVPGPRAGGFRRPALTVSGPSGHVRVIDVADAPAGPWREWQRVVLGEDGHAELVPDQGAKMRFYRAREE